MPRFHDARAAKNALKSWRSCAYSGAAGGGLMMVLTAAPEGPGELAPRSLRGRLPSVSLQEGDF